MNRIFRANVLAILFMAFLSSCATTGAKFSLQQIVNDGKARIVFYRPKDFMGSAVSFSIQENSVEILKIRNGQFISYITEPDANVYSIKTLGNSNELKLGLEPNQTYYVRLAIRSGAFLNTLYLSRVYESEALEDLAVCCKSGKQ